MIWVVHSVSGSRDPGSWYFTHPVSLIQGSKSQQIPDPDPQHCHFFIQKKFHKKVIKWLTTYYFTHFFTSRIQILICSSGLWICVSGSERNICWSTTLAPAYKISTVLLVQWYCIYERCLATNHNSVSESQQDWSPFHSCLLSFCQNFWE